MDLSSTGAHAQTQGGRYFPDFAAGLRYWRGKRGFSQLRLSSEAGISQRHISFLESGRSQPSRELVLKLGTALDIPLRQRNELLLAAGFAPAYRERRLSDPELQSVRQALDFMLRQQAPFPALVVDRLWNLVMMNVPAQRLMRWLLGIPAAIPLPPDDANAIGMMLDPAALRPWILNWREVAGDALQWIQREALAEGPGGEAARLLDRLRALAGEDTLLAVPDLEARGLPFMPIEIGKDGVRLKLFTTIATLGTPHDVTVHELRIESFFPADAETERWFRAQAG